MQWKLLRFQLHVHVQISAIAPVVLNELREECLRGSMWRVYEATPLGCRKATYPWVDVLMSDHVLFFEITLNISQLLNLVSQDAEWRHALDSTPPSAVNHLFVVYNDPLCILTTILESTAIGKSEAGHESDLLNSRMRPFLDSNSALPYSYLLIGSKHLFSMKTLESYYFVGSLHVQSFLHVQNAALWTLYRARLGI